LNPVERNLNAAGFHHPVVRWHSELKYSSGILPDCNHPQKAQADSHPVEELPAVGKAFTDMSPHFIPKIPCALNGLGAAIGR